MNAPQIEPLGDSAVIIRLGDHIEDAISDAALALAQSLKSSDVADVLDIAPSYASICVRYDMSRVRFETIAQRLRDAMANADAKPSIGAPIDAIAIPVCYGGEFGIDLGEVAQQCRIDSERVIELHCAGNYTVAMLGFMPGFPYLRGLHRDLHTPRLDAPRERVPAGSVAIGGAQTGIYPRELPGGWRVIGRTPLTLFDASREPPALLAPGQRVRFTRIDSTTFGAMSR